MTPEEKRENLVAMVNEAIAELDERGYIPDYQEKRADARPDNLYGLIVSATYFKDIADGGIFSRPVRIYFSRTVADDYVLIATREKIKELLGESDENHR